MREADDIAEQFVVDLAAADPVLATYGGILGHEHELPDYTPDGYAAREDLLRRARAAMVGATPSDDRERVAQSSFLERADVGLAQDEAHQPQSRISVIDSAAHEIRGVFDLMATETRRTGRRSAPGSAPCRRRSPTTGRPSSTRPTTAT